MRLRSDGGRLNSPSPAADRPGQGCVLQARATRGPRRAQERKVPRGFGMTAPGWGLAGVRGRGEGMAGGEGLRAPEVGAPGDSLGAVDQEEAGQRRFWDAL